MTTQYSLNMSSPSRTKTCGASVELMDKSLMFHPMKLFARCKPCNSFQSTWRLSFVEHLITSRDTWVLRLIAKYPKNHRGQGKLEKGCPRASFPPPETSPVMANRCIPHVTSTTDPALLAPFTVYTTIIVAAAIAISRRDTVVIWGLAFIVVPFMPSSNVLLSVGAVVAERVRETRRIRG